VGDDVRVWDLTLRRAGQRLTGSFRATGAVAYAPDGRTLAVATAALTVELLDPLTMQPRRQLRGHTATVNGVAYSPDGTRLATGGQDGTLRLWRADGEPLRAVAANGPVQALAWSPDGRRIATATGGQVVRLWDPETGAEAGRASVVADPAAGLAFAGTGRLAVASGRQVRIWDLAANREGRALDHPFPVSRLAVSRDGRHLATGEANGLVNLWDLATGESRGRNGGPRAAVRSLEFSPGGKTLAVGDDLCQVLFFDLATMRRRNDLFLYHDGLDGLALAPDGKGVVTVSPAGGLDFALMSAGLDEPVGWMRQPTWKRNRPAGQPLRSVTSLAFTADGRTLVTGSRPLVAEASNYRSTARDWRDFRAVLGPTDDLRLWDAATGLEQTVLADQSSVGVEGLGVTPDGRRLVAAGLGGVIWRWDLRERKPLPLLFAGPEARAYWESWRKTVDMQIVPPIRAVFPENVRVVAVSPDGQTFATASDRGAVRLWDLETGRMLRTFAERFAATPRVAFSPDGTLRAANDGPVVHAWDPATGELRQTFAGHVDVVQSLAFSPDGRTLAAGGRDRRIKLWDVATARELGTLVGHSGSVTAVGFTVDGRTLASGGWDGLILLWNLAGRQELMSLEGHGGRITALAFSPDGSTLASGSELTSGAGEVILWRSTPRDAPEP
jgi:WD40 repeat protein